MEYFDTTHPTMEEVAAELRAKYKKHTPEQREIYGDEPSLGTIEARWARIHCNNMTEEEGAALHAYAMSIINGATNPAHAGHTTRS